MNNRGKGPNPLSRVHESNGPDVKIRGTVHHIIEKYMQLARDAQASGDRVTAENYYQHAEHYFRVLVAAQQQISPHMAPSIRVDDQSYDDDLDDAEGVPRASDSEAVNNGTYVAPMPPQQQNDERRDHRDQQRYEGRGRYTGERQNYQPRNDQARPAPVPSERSEIPDQPSADFPAREEGRGFSDRPPRAERIPRHEPRRDIAVEQAPAPVTAEVVVDPVAEINNAIAGREPGLPSFLTRGRRRGRPAYRRRDENEGEEPTSTSASDGDIVRDEKPETPVTS